MKISATYRNSHKAWGPLMKNRHFWGTPHTETDALAFEADRMGVIYAAKAGYDPRAAISFWQKMAKQKESGVPSTAKPAWLSTHPADQKRIADLQAFMPQVGPVYEANRGKFP